MAFDRRAVASRIRELVGSPESTELDDAAMRLGVSARTMRSALDEDDPWPTPEMLRIVITEWGIDPSWLVTGVYDPETHRRALEDTGHLQEILRQLIGESGRHA